MTRTWTVCGFTGLLVLVPVTVCATITYVNNGNEDPALRCVDRSSASRSNKTFSQCKYDVDCIPNAFCRNQQTCSCKDDYIEFRSNNNYKCLRVATRIGDPCEEDVQCEYTFTPQSECREGACQCAHDSHFTNGRCYESVGLGKRCRSNRNCHIKNTFCEYGFCTCGLRHHANPDNTSCVPSAKLGEHCNSDDECIVENSKCMHDRCDCKVDYVLAKGEQRCLKVASWIGEKCEQQSQCQLFLKHSQCGTNKTCDCVPGSHRRGHRCFVDVELGGRCETHHHCITTTLRDSNSTWKSKVDCVDGFCTCNEDYTLMEELQDCVQFSDNGATRWQVYRIFPIIVIIARFFLR
ncbi:prion-like-(Q/N-rich) domain-bearing protein 25 isoform X2 [Monomorium pharaonis]|uniref:prion-like-(Q/N-rich) domain-bearing protein 25 isoform X2 n=1 Tax=Monomorium pharaonis TaxID=307658 RepID=UPI00063F73AA|nr:prion-like-(Q/N-rich) domain-bearing protein 25 isoform X2 [Monomorium pharaonis]